MDYELLHNTLQYAEFENFNNNVADVDELGVECDTF